jgi:tetratricopeptide (TPR) repeat protein
MMCLQAEDNAAKSKLRMAAEDYKAALAMDPDHTLYNVNLYLGLCKTLVKLGRGKEAISSCTEALSIDEELVDALAQVTLLISSSTNNHAFNSECKYSVSQFLDHALCSAEFNRKVVRISNRYGFADMLESHFAWTVSGMQSYFIQHISP